LYEFAFNIGLMLLLIFVFRPRKKFDGEALCWYMLGYGIMRFPMEGLRTDSLMFFNTGLRSSQIMSVLFVVVSIAVIVVGRRRVAHGTLASATHTIVRDENRGQSVQTTKGSQKKRKKRR
jgi:phosphatidylglycerol:prolipoprotein diacylglycerol transferase